MNRTIQAVAVFEALKGVVVLLASSAVLSLAHKDLHALALSLVEHAHLNPAAKYPQIFLAAAGDLHNVHLLGLALGAAAYSLLRFVEAYGLYRERVWAEMLAAVEAATAHESWLRTLKQNRWEPSRLAGKDLAEFMELDLTTARVMVYLLKLKA